MKINAFTSWLLRLAAAKRLPATVYLRGSYYSTTNTTAQPPQSGSDELLARELYFDAQVVRLVLSAERRRNVLTLEMMDALCKELREIDDIEKVRTVILAHRGPAFSAGHDLKELTDEHGVHHHRLVFKRCSELMLLIQSMKLPVIAEVSGVAAAAGCQLAASCDIVVAAETARFMVNGLNVGLFCSTPGIPLARNVPRKLAIDMLLTARVIDAQEALRAGLVSRLAVAPQTAAAEALNVAESILTKSRNVTALGKAFFYSQLETANIFNAYRQGEVVMCENLKLTDAQMGIQAFVEKNKVKPDWTHSNKKVL